MKPLTVIWDQRFTVLSNTTLRQILITSLQDKTSWCPSENDSNLFTV